MARAPGNIRDAIVGFMAEADRDVSVAEIVDAVGKKLGAVSPSSVRSYLNLNVPETFARTGRGKYRLKQKIGMNGHAGPLDAMVTSGRITSGTVTSAVFISGKAKLYHADCFAWLEACNPVSIHAIVTDPPYGLVEYTEKEQAKLRRGRGGVWRIPPSFDGHKRAPLPRFTVLDADDLKKLHAFFKRLGTCLGRVLVPGANVIIASNPLLSHIVAAAMSEGGLELRGYISRLTMTMRGGDRPKNAHREFDGVSVMPRSMWEPWVILRKQLDGRVQDNLRKWGTGGFRRLSADQPFGDVIHSNPTPRAERLIAPHPSLKPQDFLRKVVRAALPLGTGIILDPFAGSGSTLAASNAVGYDSIGLEKDLAYVEMAVKSIPLLAALGENHPSCVPLVGVQNGKIAEKSDGTSHQEGGRVRRERDGRARGAILRASQCI
jgi:DNA modification methylase